MSQEMSQDKYKEVKKWKQQNLMKKVDWLVYWSKPHDPNRWERPETITVFSSRLAKFLEKTLNVLFKEKRRNK